MQAQYDHLTESKTNWLLKAYNEEHKELSLVKNDAKCLMKIDANYWTGAHLSAEENTSL